MKAEPFLSIIVPVYNVENYIRQCLDSILSASFQDYELILVVGNSSDNSNLICREYQEHFPGIAVITQNGKGLSNARNCGVSVADGKYIMFVDSDDYIDSDMFDHTIHQFHALQHKTYDVLISDFTFVNAEEKLCTCRTQIRNSEKIIEEYEYLKKFLSGRGNYWNVWRYLYRREFLCQHKLSFKENYKSEDIDYSTRVLLEMSSCCFYHNPYYCYRVRRQGSLVNDISLQNVNNLLEILEDSVARISSSKDFPYKRFMQNKLLIEYVYSFLLIKDIPPKDQKTTFHYISSRKNLLKETFSGSIIYIIISIVGIRTIAAMLFQIRKYRRKLLFEMRILKERTQC